MTGKLSKNFHGVGIGPLSKILAVKSFRVALLLSPFRPILQVYLDRVSTLNSLITVEVGINV